MSDDPMRRLQRVYAAIGEAIDTDAFEFRPVTRRDGDQYATSVRFDEASEEEMQNTIYSAVHNVANLRDHLKKWARQHGKDSGVIDKAVDASPELKMVVDLSNRDKHGGPPRDGGLSGLSPNLVRFRRGMTSVQPGQTVTTFTIFFGEAPNVAFGEGAAVMTSADVVDLSGNVVGDAIALLNVAVGQWEQVLRECGLAPEEQPG